MTPNRRHSSSFSSHPSAEDHTHNRLASLNLDGNRSESALQDRPSMTLKSPRSSTTYTSNLKSEFMAKLVAFQGQRQSKTGSSASSPLQESNFDTLTLSHREDLQQSRGIESIQLPLQVPHHDSRPQLQSQHHPPPQLESLSQPEFDSHLEFDSHFEHQPESQSQPQPPSQVEAQQHPLPWPQPRSQPQHQFQSQIQPLSQPQSQPQPQFNHQPQYQPQSQSQSQSQFQPQVLPLSQSQSQSQSQSPLHPQSQPQLQEQPHTQLHLPPQSQSQPQSQPHSPDQSDQHHPPQELKKNKPLPPLPPTSKANRIQLPQDIHDRLNPARPPPVVPNKSQVVPQVTARMPKQKQSLSQRRGMKLPGGLPHLGGGNNGGGGIGGGGGGVGGNGSSASGATSRGIVPGGGSSGSAGDSTDGSFLKSSAASSSVISNSFTLDSKPSLPSKGSQFLDFSKYVDIKSGSLNFGGKLSLDSNGVNFQSGQKLNISGKDLEIMEELGRGNYGTVTKVLHRPTNVVMAAKEVRLELDENKFRQILMELEVLHQCESPYIVDFFGAFFVEGAVYMCIEYMDAGSLDKIYADGVDEPRLAFITKSVVKGLKELKDHHSVIHRDVKPTNILVNTNGEVKLCDFGVSGNLVASLAKTNIGCQSYMAPERIKSLNPDDSTYSVQSDIWSLGLTILETAKGSYPYPPETYDNIFSQLSAIVEGSPPELPKSFSEEARDFVSQCLDKNPYKRPNYAELLNHKWLNKYTDEEVNMGDYIKERVRQIKLNKAENNARSFEELNEKLKTPALHRGGAPPQDKTFLEKMK